MKRTIVPALLACGVLASSALAQSAVETPSRADRAASADNASPDSQSGAQRQAGLGRTVEGQDAQGPSSQANQPGGLDQHIAACLLLGNQEEVAIAEFAQEKCQSEECKKFATMLLEQHQQAIAKIEQAAPQVAAQNLRLRNAGDNSQNQRQPQSESSRTQTAIQGAGGENPQLLLARQIKEECLAGVKKELGEKQGAEFDKCFIGQQVVGHLQMLATLKASEPFASEELKPVIQEGLQMTEKHLAEAKKLAKQLDQSQREPRQARAQ